MAFRFALSFGLLSVAMSIAIPVEHHHHESPAEYEFSYAVNDHSTGDIKSHQESRKGHAVTGKYELIDSDGYRRIVEYTADEHTGFNAVVKREPTDIVIPIFKSQSHESVHHSYEPSVQHSYEPVQHSYEPVHYSQKPVVHHSFEQVHESYKPVHHSIEQVQHLHEPANHYNHIDTQPEHKIVPAQQAYVAPKVAKKLLESIVKVEPIEVTEPSTEAKSQEEEQHEQHVLQVKYVAPKATVAKVAEHLNTQILNTHVSYNAPEFNYHY